MNTAGNDMNGNGEDRLYSKKEIAELLGISLNTISAWVSQRKIPFIKLGKLVRFKLDDLVKWLSNKRIMPKDYN